MPGPPKTPTAILKMRGSWRARVRKDEPQPAKGAPRPPGWLDREARAEWRRIVPELDKVGIIAIVDRAALAILCQSWADYYAARREVETQGWTVTTPAGLIRRNPMVAVMNQAYERWRKMALQFGMTPSARAGLARPKENPDENRGKARFFKHA